MELVDPFEGLRRLQLFWQDFKGDFELRFPETRGRLALAMKLQLAPEDLPLFKNIIDRFLSAKRVVSVFDWHILVEWSERKSQAFCVAEIRQCLQEKRVPGAIADALFARLKEILDQMRSQILIDQPSLWASLHHRWNFSPLRDEAYYLAARIREHQKKAA